jgi:hypothetical protein
MAEQRSSLLTSAIAPLDPVLTGHHIIALRMFG